MERRRNLALIDGNFRRRAAITHALAGGLVHVEPFEDIDEITMRWPRGGAILVADDGAAVEELIEHMTDHGAWLPVIAFSDRVLSIDTLPSAAAVSESAKVAPVFSA